MHWETSWLTHNTTQSITSLGSFEISMCLPKINQINHLKACLVNSCHLNIVIITFNDVDIHV